MRPVTNTPPTGVRCAALTVLAFLVAFGPVAATGDEGAKPAAKTGKSCCTPEAADAAPDAGGAYQRSVEQLSVPDLTLVRMDGRKVSLRDELASDTPVMVNFIFTTCTTICPVMSATFSQVQAGLGEEQSKVRMVSISIDPEQDTPARLRDYARRHEAGPEWHFLTGSVEQIDTVQKAFNAYRGSKFNHAPLTFLRMPGDTRWVRIEGLVQAEVIIDEYEKLAAAL